MTRIAQILALSVVLVACSDDPSSPVSGEELEVETIASTGSSPVPTVSGPELSSGRVEYLSGDCPIAGRDPGLAVPDGAIVQALECDGSTCYDAADLLFVDNDEAFLVACLDAERYEIRWLALR